MLIGTKSKPSMVIHETQEEKEYNASQSELHRLFHVEWY